MAVNRTKRERIMDYTKSVYPEWKTASMIAKATGFTSIDVAVVFRGQKNIESRVEMNNLHFYRWIND